MTEEAKHLIYEALKLAVSDRAEIVAEIIASMDGEPDSDVEKAWASEIEKRVNQIRSGSAVGRPWSEVKKDLERRSG